MYLSLTPVPTACTPGLSFDSKTHKFQCEPVAPHAVSAAVHPSTNSSRLTALDFTAARASRVSCRRARSSCKPSFGETLSRIFSCRNSVCNIDTFSSAQSARARASSASACGKSQRAASERRTAVKHKYIQFVEAGHHCPSGTHPAPRYPT